VGPVALQRFSFWLIGLWRSGIRVEPGQRGGGAPGRRHVSAGPELGSLGVGCLGGAAGEAPAQFGQRGDGQVAACVIAWFAGAADVGALITQVGVDADRDDVVAGGRAVGASGGRSQQVGSSARTWARSRRQRAVLGGPGIRARLLRVDSGTPAGRGRPIGGWVGVGVPGSNPTSIVKCVSATRRRGRARSGRTGRRC
jgi:hypothetical protein